MHDGNTLEPPPDALRTFRRSFYECLHCRSDALFKLYPSISNYRFQHLGLRTEPEDNRTNVSRGRADKVLSGRYISIGHDKPTNQNAITNP